ncbi:MBT domain-containing protein 1-like isoform X2 [Rhopilema esculentum]|uniref:MBT domain-containing protein 1-like isoform X2 n=1 Tax=Rhopilema esculentum TaxID=499914 RepID=UPI0031D36C6A
MAWNVNIFRKHRKKFQAEDNPTQAGILSFYGEEEHPELASEHESLDEIASGAGSLVAGEENAILHGSALPMADEPVEGDLSTTSEWDDSLTGGDQEGDINIPAGMALCELCGHLGDRESFYSKSKRFCRMECAKKFSACQKKNTNRNILGKRPAAKKRPRVASKQKRQRLDTPLEASLESPSSSAQSASSWIDQVFSWDEYLKSTGDKPAPEHFFKHTMRAPTLSEIHVGMKVEVVNCSNGTPKDNETAYWVATILKVNVNMMLLRYEGYEDDGVDDFWFDVRSKNVHPVGWCYSVQKLLIPPPAIKSRRSNWQQYLFKKLSGARTFSNDFLERVQNGNHNKFDIGMKVEVSDKHNLVSMCVATIVDIVGDRLRLRYDGLDAEMNEDFLCHYLSCDIHPVGWSSLVGHTLQPPVGWKQGLTEWNEFLAEDLQNSRDAPQECFVPESMGTPPSRYGHFEPGAKFEAIDPLNPSNIIVATVIKSLRFNYFIAGIDSTTNYFICHANSRSIFPVHWCKNQKISLTLPKEYSGKSFDWVKYLAKTGGKRVSSLLFKQCEKRINPFQPGMKIEAVDLREPSFICPATIIESKGPLVRVHFDGWDATFDQWCDCESLDLFPVGWCEKNGHPLQPPGSQMPDVVLEAIRPKRPDFSVPSPSLKMAQPKEQAPQQNPLSGGKPSFKPAKIKRENSFEKKPASALRIGNPPRSPASQKVVAKAGCNMIYFNQHCASGPFLNPHEVVNLPDSITGALIGPPHQNCIRKCLHHIVNAAIDPNQVLELFSKEFYQTKQNKDLKLDHVICVEITGKSGKRFLRRVRVPSKQNLIPKYLARVCSMLKCCPSFVCDERFFGGKCDTNCNQQYNETHALPDSQTGEEFDDIRPRTSKMPPTQYLDSPGGPSSSTQDRGFDPLNMLDEESVRSKDPRTWTVNEVMDFLAAIGCQDHAMTFQKQEIDGKALLLLPANALEALTDNKLGPITKLMDALQSLKKMWGLHS